MPDTWIMFAFYETRPNFVQSIVYNGIRYIRRVSCITIGLNNVCLGKSRNLRKKWVTIHEKKVGITISVIQMLEIPSNNFESWLKKKRRRKKVGCNTQLKSILPHTRSEICLEFRHELLKRRLASCAQRRTTVALNHVRYSMLVA